ncbi:hypothetical protein A3464_07060 [Enterobacter genomosp. O]|nr:hypothetical protein A3464_07060 [Enterobacter genomosp. O]
MNEFPHFSKFLGVVDWMINGRQVMLTLQKIPIFSVLKWCIYRTREHQLSAMTTFHQARFLETSLKVYVSRSTAKAMR